MNSIEFVGKQWSLIAKEQYFFYILAFLYPRFPRIMSPQHQSSYLPHTKLFPSCFKPFYSFLIRTTNPLQMIRKPPKPCLQYMITSQLSCNIKQSSKSMQKDSKSARRKRKDPQSRDYLCKCGKSYLSYAAAYTHVKNKHDLEKDYVDNIKKPEREQLKRGRPKEKKENSHNFQTSLLTLIESAILKICTEIETVFEKTILEGNQERDQFQFNFYYESLCKTKEDLLSGFQLGFDDSFNDFAEKLNKDFTCEIACKIKLISAILSCLQSEDEQSYYQQKLNELNLWKDRNHVNQIILETYKEWKSLCAQENNQNTHFDQPQQ